MNIPFTKVVGTGNDFVIVDTIRQPQPTLRSRWRTLSQAMCDRHAGIGADGVLVLERSDKAHARMKVFNPDGSEADMCGNGARGVAYYLAHGGAKGQITIETKAGVLRAKVQKDRVAVRMTEPTGLQLDLSLEQDDQTMRVGCINTGVPHAVIAVDQLDDVNVLELGRALRSHRVFGPQGSNVNFIQPDSARESRIQIRTYERGVEAETLACGTGVAASAVIYALGRQTAHNGTDRHRVEVQTRSGDVLNVSFAARREGRQWKVTDIVLEGRATMVFEGTFVWPLKRGT